MVNGARVDLCGVRQAVFVVRRVLVTGLLAHWIYSGKFRRALRVSVPLLGLVEI